MGQVVESEVRGGKRHRNASRGLSWATFVIAVMAFVFAIVGMMTSAPTGTTYQVRESIASLHQVDTDIRGSVTRLSDRVNAVEQRGSTTPRANGATTDQVRIAIERSVTPLRERVKRLEDEQQTTPTDPTPSSSVLRRSSGAPITISYMQRNLERTGFRFQPSPLLDGTPRVLGQKHTTMIELYGDENLTRVVLVGLASEDDDTTNGTIVEGIERLLELAAPGAVGWMENAIRQAVARAEATGTGTAQTTAPGRVVYLEVGATIGSFTLTIEPA